MNLAVLVALKMIHDQNQADARRRRRARDEARRKKNAPKSSSSSSYSSKQYDETEYFNLVVTEDPILTTFFKELEKKGQEIDEQDAEEIRKVIEEKLKLQAGRVEKIDKIFEEIKASGLDIKLSEYSYYGSQVTVGEKVLDSGKRAFGEKGDYAESTRKFEIEYKGITLSREWFKGDRKKENPLEANYNSWLEENKDLESEIAAQEEAIKKQERKYKYALFGRDDKLYELADLKKRLKQLEEQRAHGEELKRKRDAFAEITPKQKDQIEKYYELVDECKEQGKSLNTDIEKYKRVKGIYRGYYYSNDKNEEERNKWQRAIDSLTEDGEVSEELLDAIDTIISEENIGYQKYSEGKDSYAMEREGYSREFSNVVAWYLETRREKIATKALHRKEEAYKALAVEHKKLCEMAGLVAEAEKIEDSANKKGDDGHGEHGEDE